MPTKFQLFKQKLINNFIMPKEVKAKVVGRNLKILFKVSIGLFILSVVSLIHLFISPDNKGAETGDYIFYYTTMAAVELFTLILFPIFSKIKVLRRSNILVIFNFASLIFFCYLLFIYGVNPFNPLLIFVCLATIIPLLYAIEPLYYTIIVLSVGLMMGPRFFELYGPNSASNAIVYIFIMSGLAMSRWFYIKRNSVHEHNVKEREKQIQQELEMAALVQKSFYQHNLSDLDDWKIAYYNDPMISLSGDLFDFYIRQNKISGLCIFDVSGHGLASGLVTMLVKNAMEEEFYDNLELELDFTMQRINERVRVEKGSIENYLTGIILRFTEKNIEMVNAGHPRPVIYHSATNSCEFFQCELKDRVGAIGLGDLNFDFKTLEVNLEPKDRIILYTDGVTEAKNILNNEYGDERFLASVQKHCNLDVESQIAAITGDIKQFIGTASRTDDISIIIIEKK